MANSLTLQHFAFWDQEFRRRTDPPRQHETRIAGGMACQWTWALALLWRHYPEQVVHLNGKKIFHEFISSFIEKQNANLELDKRKSQNWQNLRLGLGTGFALGSHQPGCASQVPLNINDHQWVGTTERRWEFWTESINLRCPVSVSNSSTTEYQQRSLSITGYY